MRKQKTIHEKWEADSKDGVRFSDEPGTQNVILVGPDDALKELFGEEKVRKHKQSIDEIDEMKKGDSDKDVRKFNPYHDAMGRFSSASGATSFTYRTNSPAGQKAIENIKARSKASGGSASGSKSSKEKPKANQEQIDRVKRFEDDLISELKRNLKPEYRDEYNTVHDLLNDRTMERDIDRVKTSVKNNDKSEMKRLKDEFTKTSKDYAAPWYDDDLGYYRSGYDWESNFYRKLADLCEPRPSVSKRYEEIDEV